MPRNWVGPGKLQRASYRGVQFWVEKDDLETGRRLVIHEFPHRDDPYVEDMGRDTNKVAITAYVASDTADAEEKSLRRACESGGAATLQLPMERMKAHCEKCKRTFDRDRLGFIAFALSFVRDGGGAGPYSTPYLAQMVRAAADEIATPLKVSFLESYQGLGVAGYVKASAVEAIRLLAADLEGVRAVTMLESTLAPGIKTAITKLAEDAEELAAVGSVGDTYTGVSVLATSQTSLEAPIVARVTALMSALRSAIEPESVPAALGPIFAFSTGTAAGVVTPSRVREAKNLAAIAMLARVAALTELCVAVADMTFADRRAAIQVRADLVEAIEAELEQLQGPESYAAALALIDLRGRAVEYLSRAIADLAPVVVVGAPNSMPSLWWANRLYGDAARATELAERNRIKHPGFMPAEFEALVE